VRRRERRPKPPFMSQGQAKLGKCTRRQLRKVKFSAKGGENDGVEVLAGRSSEFGGKSANEIVEARKNATSEKEESVLRGHGGVEESVKKRCVTIDFSPDEFLDGLAINSDH